MRGRSQASPLLHLRLSFTKYIAALRSSNTAMTRPDVCIAGAGIIGVTLALSLHQRGLSVVVLSAGNPMAEASTAAAGMLAVEDPGNPPELLALSRFSRSLYPALLDRLAETSHSPVSFQTHRTLQALAPAALASNSLALPLSSSLPDAALSDLHFLSLAEESLDPRELAPALIAAAQSARIDLRSSATVLSVDETAASVLVRTSAYAFEAEHFVDCTGAWSLSSARVPTLRISPRKGQMLTVPTPASLASGIVLRSHQIYMVPRLHGPRAGETVIGATVEDVGFDRSVNARQLGRLINDAATLLPELRNAPIRSSWAGLRPATEDLLPAIGRLPGSHRLLIASGHYRNGILLAPGTAFLLTQCIAGESLALSLNAFAPNRFAT